MNWIIILKFEINQIKLCNDLLTTKIIIIKIKFKRYFVGKYFVKYRHYNRIEIIFFILKLFVCFQIIYSLYIEQFSWIPNCMLAISIF